MPVKLLQPEVKWFNCVDHDPIENWVPGTDSVSYNFTLAVGLVNDPACDNFQVLVCTPRGLSEVKASGILIGPAPPIVLSDYSWSAVVEETEERLRECRGSKWIEIQEMLRRQFRWEYEDYR